MSQIKALNQALDRVFPRRHDDKPATRFEGELTLRPDGALRIYYSLTDFGDGPQDIDIERVCFNAIDNGDAVFTAMTEILECGCSSWDEVVKTFRNPSSENHV